jgi:spore coat polysaccharide biosynthesis predicted glycosyltransferase SpsG
MILNNKADFVIVAAGSPELGLGHIRRSSVLAAHMRRVGLQVKTFRLNTAHLIPIELLNSGEVLILDLPPSIQREVLSSELSTDVPVVTLDGRSGKSAVDISIIPREGIVSCQRYSGFSYAIVSDNFISSQSSSFTASELGNRVCVCIGGGDINGHGVESTLLLRDLGFEVTLILGPFTKHSYAEIPKKGVKVIKNPKNLHEHFAQSDWLVVNAGGTLFEGLTMGKPSVSLPQTEDELEVAQKLFSKGLILGVGMESIKHYKDSDFTELSKSARDLFDGMGKNRITRILMKRYL